MSILVSFVVFILVALICLVLILLLMNLQAKAPNPKKVPRCELLEPLSEKETALFNDLTDVLDRHELGVAARMSLAGILQPAKGVENARKWKELLGAYYADFAILDRMDGRVLLIIVAGDPADEARADWNAVVEKAAMQAGLPIMPIRDYNLPGLEKGILGKLNRPLTPSAKAATEEPVAEEKPA